MLMPETDYSHCLESGKSVSKTQTPINAVIMNFIVEELLLLLIFGGDVSIGSILVLVHLLDSFHLLCQHF